MRVVMNKWLSNGKLEKILLITNTILIIAIVTVCILYILYGRGKNNQQNVTPAPTGSSTMTETPTITETPVPEEGTPIPTPTSAPTPTETPTEAPTEIPTETPKPTPTSTPTPTEALVLSDFDIYRTTPVGWGMKRNEDHTTPNVWGVDTLYNFDENDTYYVNKNVAEGDKVIYLTFDSGYENGCTEDILDILKKYNIKSTFFVTKGYIQSSPEIVIRMKEEGHMVGNHTVTHPNLGEVTTEQIINEINGCADYMKEVTGYEMDKYIRPPEGAFSEKSLKVTQALGYKTILWSLTYPDWDQSNQPTVEYILNHFQVNHHNGAITLTHSVSKGNRDALESVIQYLLGEGYRFGTLDELGQ